MHEPRALGAEFPPVGVSAEVDHPDAAPIESPDALRCCGIEPEPRADSEVGVGLAQLFAVGERVGPVRELDHADPLQQ